MRRRFEVKIDLENAAFDEVNPGFEVARILRNLAARLQDYTCDTYHLQDANGKAVGTATFGKASFRRVK